MTRPLFGRRSQSRRGRAWEELLAAHHRAYNARGAAVIWRNEPEVRNLGAARGGFLACYTGRALPDYSGVCEGRFWHAEAKRFAGPSLPWEALRPHQAVDLERAVRAGCGGYLLVYSERLGTGHLIAWVDVRVAWFGWRQRWERGEESPNGTASLSLDGLAKVSRYTSKRSRGFDYLPALLTHLCDPTREAERASICAAPIPVILPDLKRGA